LQQGLPNEDGEEEEHGECFFTFLHHLTLDMLIMDHEFKYNDEMFISSFDQQQKLDSIFLLFLLTSYSNTYEKDIFLVGFSKFTLFISISVCCFFFPCLSKKGRRKRVVVVVDGPLLQFE